MKIKGHGQALNVLYGALSALRLLMDETQQFKTIFGCLADYSLYLDFIPILEKKNQDKGTWTGLKCPVRGFVRSEAVDG